MGDAGASFGSFGGGFLKGLANTLHRNQQQKREDERIKQAKRDQVNLAIMPQLFEASGGDWEAMEPWLQQAFPDTFGAVGKSTKGTKGKPRALDAVSRVFGHFKSRLPGMGGDTILESGFPGGTVTMDGPGQGGSTGNMPRPNDGVSRGMGEAMTPTYFPPNNGMAEMMPIPGHVGPPAVPQPIAPHVGPPATPQPLGTVQSSRTTQSPMTAAIAPLLAAQQNTGVASPPSELSDVGAAVAPATPGTPAASTAPRRRTFQGVPLLTPEELADRAALKPTAAIQARVRAAEKYATVLLQNGQANSPAEAFRLAADLFGLYSTQSATGGASVRSIRGVDANGTAVQAVWDPATRSHVYATGEKDKDGKDISGQVIPGFVAQGSTVTFGQDREALAKTMFNKSFNALTPPERTQVVAAETALLEREATARARGTGQGQFETPIDVKTAGATGAVVGTNSAAYAGQTVGRPEDIEARRMLDDLNITIARVTDPQPRVDEQGKAAGLLSNSLLDILPTDAGLAGAIPGATIFAKRNSNFASGLVDEQGKPLTNREAMARLDSNIQNMINAFARVRGQRGAQTEPDAERAYQSLIDLKGNLLNPLKGDTRDSAKARMTEAKAIIDRMIKATPGRPVPNTQGGQPGAPGAAPTGGPDPANPKAPYQDANGRWIIP